MVRELAENNFLKDFGQEGEVLHWSVFLFVLFFVLNISGLRVVFLRRGFTIADLKADGKKAGVHRVIVDRCEVWKKIVETMGKKR